jgi:hypothetical protein
MELSWIPELVPGTVIRPNCSGIFQEMSANRLELAPFPVSRVMAGMPQTDIAVIQSALFRECAKPDVAHR